MGFRLMACRAFRPFIAVTQAVDVDVVAELIDEDGDAVDLEAGVSEDPEEVSLTPPAHVVDTGGADWAARVLDIVRALLAHESRTELELYAFQAFPEARRLSIRLDKLTDARGSPTLDDITDFTASLTEAMHRELGEETTASLDYEISSPGALRKLVIPRELERFRTQAMEMEVEVESLLSLDKQGLRLPPAIQNRAARRGCLTLAAEFQSLAQDDPGVGVWRLLDVGLNWAALGRKRGQRLGSALLQRDFHVPLAALKCVRFHIDLSGLGR